MAYSEPAKALCSICAAEPGIPEAQDAELTLLDCKHRVCATCLSHMFTTAVRSKPFYPARCCMPIELEHLVVGLPADVASEHMDAYLARLEEFECPAKLYCHHAVCSAFIPPGMRSHRVGTCPACAAKTCKRCRTKSHWGPCKPEALRQAVHGDEQLLQLAESKRWKRCPSCSVMIEKSHGCTHMVCVCGSQFCYMCGEPYLPSGEHHCKQGGDVEILD